MLRTVVRATLPTWENTMGILFTYEVKAALLPCPCPAHPGRDAMEHPQVCVWSLPVGGDET